MLYRTQRPKQPLRDSIFEFLLSGKQFLNNIIFANILTVVMDRFIKMDQN